MYVPFLLEVNRRVFYQQRTFFLDIPFPLCSFASAVPSRGPVHDGELGLGFVAGLRLGAIVASGLGPL
jgi:hypothetical protein